MKRPDPKKLATRAEMLKTLRMAYQNLLDMGVFTVPGAWPPPDMNRHRQRLSVKRERDLGYRLAAYWEMQS